MKLLFVCDEIHLLIPRFPYKKVKGSDFVMAFDYSNTFSSYPDVVSVKELQAMLHVGRNTAYSLLKGGSIKTLRFGRKYIIPKQNVIDFLLNT